MTTGRRKAARVTWAPTPCRAGDVPGFVGWWRRWGHASRVTGYSGIWSPLTRAAEALDGSHPARGHGASALTPADSTLVFRTGDMLPVTSHVGRGTPLRDCPWPAGAPIEDRGRHRSLVENVGVSLVDGKRAAVDGLLAASAIGTAVRRPGGAWGVAHEDLTLGVLATRRLS